MASPLHAVLCALLATAFWSWLGLALARHLLPLGLCLAVAPVLGWAVQSAVFLPVFFLIGFSPAAIVAAGALCVLVAAWALRLPAPASADPGAAWPSPFAYVAAALLAIIPAVAILPKFTAAGVHLADPIFDHAKIAIIDAMTRQGLPPVDPAFAEAGMPSRLVYYYLWHFSAAELAQTLGVSGWEADAGLTWFTAFASLSLMMGLAAWLAGRSAAAVVVVLLAAATSLRALLGWISGSHELIPFLSGPIGFAGWLFQSAWAPQHVMSASCTVLAMLLIARYARQRSHLLLLAIALVVAAGFEASTYVGGVTFAVAAVAAAPVLLVAVERGQRLRFSSGLVLAAVLVVAIALPFLFAQFSAVAMRGDRAPVVIYHFEVLGDMFPLLLRRVLDVPAYWLIELPIEFPAAYVAGVIGLVALLRKTRPGPPKTAVAAFACLAAAGLVCSWLLRSTVGDNNDLGLRAILPANMALIVAAAAAAFLLSPSRVLVIAAACGGLVASLPDTAEMVASNLWGTPVPDGGVFAQSPELWEAVRRHASPTTRVANDPLFLQDLMAWPANMSWALLANRSSCFAGRELALAFAPLPAARREAINAQFIRVFAGQGTVADVHDMATKYECSVVVVVPQDKAWDHDPFAASPDYRLAESRDGRWRIYVATHAAP